MMPTAPGSRHRLSAWAYRLLLRFRYPRLRRTFGREMEADFLRLLSEAHARSGLRGWLGSWVRVLAEAVRPLPGPVRAGAGGGSGPRGDPAGRGGAGVRLWSDLTGAARTLRRAPGFTVLVAGVLGVAIAFNVAVFAVIQAYLLRPLPYPEAERLVQVQPATRAVGWRDSGDVFEKAVSWNLDGFTLVGDGAPDVVLGAWVTPDFFDVFGVHAAVGRTFTDADVDTPVAVISHDVWTRRFGADPHVVGRTLRLYPSGGRAGELRSFTIVGVLPRDFWYPNGYTQVLVPLQNDGPVYVGRLRADVPPERARRILSDRAAAEQTDQSEGAGIEVLPLNEAYTATVRRRLVVLQSVALLVFLVACANAGLLLLVRAEGREPELAMRRALGAGRRRLAVQLLAEGLLLAGLAGVLGLVLGSVGVSSLGGVIQARLGRAVPGGASALHVDVWIVLLTTAVAVLVGMLFGSVPLWSRSRRDPSRLLRSSGRGATGTTGARPTRGVLVAAEVALSLTLVTGGALMVRSALHLERTELGFEPSGLMAYTVGLTSKGSGDLSHRRDFFEALAREVEREPGVVSTGLARGAPFDLALVTRAVETDGGPATPAIEAVPQVVSPDYFGTLGIHATRGRLFALDDRAGTLPVAVVSESLARTLWPGAAAIGQRIRFSSWHMPEMSETPGTWRTIVGVVPDVVDGVEGARPTVYAPFQQVALDWMVLVIRTRPGTGDLTETVRAKLRDLDPEVPIYGHRSLDEAISRTRAPSRFFAGLLGGFSAFALLLAVLGLYGVAAYAARLQRRDVAVRMALGAQRASVEGLFVRQSLVVLVTGLALGALGGRLLGQALNGQLYGVAGDDTPTALAVTALLAITAVLAVWVPAHQAARMPPADVLRED